MSVVGLAAASAFSEPQAQWIWAETETTEVQFDHTTVLRQAVVVALDPKNGGVYVDATVGGGGHTEAILEAAPGARVIAFDRDEVALGAARERLRCFGDRVTLVHGNYDRARDELGARGVERVDGLCADLGVSSPQLDDAARGMSFRREGPLDMRMDQSSGESAIELIERLDDDALADLLYAYGEERRSRRIARSIRRALDDGELGTTLDLRRAVVRAVGPARIGGVDPATRTFQALRIAVNDEIGGLERLLGQLDAIVAPAGVAALLSFHSLEDRPIKRAFQQKDRWAPLQKKPICATDEEVAANPRARSAKLRAARRVGGA